MHGVYSCQRGRTAAKELCKVTPWITHFPCVRKPRLSSHAQSRVNPHLAEARTFIKSYVQVKCAERAECTPKAKHSYCRHHMYSICVVLPCSFMFLKPVRLPSPQRLPWFLRFPQHFDCFPLEKSGHEPFSLGDSLILQSLWECSVITVCQFLCGVSLKVRRW